MGELIIEIETNDD